MRGGSFCIRRYRVRQTPQVSEFVQKVALIGQGIILIDIVDRLAHRTLRTDVAGDELRGRR